MNRTGEKNSRGRPWDKDEIILALNAYLSGVKDSKSEPKFIKLCEFLDRSFNSVRARFGNFIHLDPKHSGQGLSAASRLVKLQEAWDEFANDPARLKSKAAAIRRKRIRAKQNQKPGRSQKSKRKVSIAVASEGKPLPRSHTGRERNSGLVREKKESVLQETGRLVCEACGFDFSERYGKRGEGFIECHHIKPLRDLKPGSKTSLDDLVLLCSNCHSMIHAKQPGLEVKDIKRLIKRRAGGRRPRKTTVKRRKGRKTP